MLGQLAVVAVVLVSCSLAEPTSLQHRSSELDLSLISQDVEVGGTGCECKWTGGCGCCVHLYVPFFINADVCANVTFNPGRLSAGVQITWGGFTIFNFTKHGLTDIEECTNDLPGEFDILPPGANACLKVNKMGFDYVNGTVAFRLCARMTVKEKIGFITVTVFRKNFGCFYIPIIGDDSTDEWGCDYTGGSTQCWSRCEGRLGLTDGEMYVDAATGTYEPVHVVGRTLFNQQGCMVGMLDPSGLYRLQ